MSQFTWTFPGGKLKQEVTEVILVNNVTKTIDVLVPAGKIWILLGVKLLNPDDVDRTVNIYKYKEAAKTNLIATLFTAAITAVTELGHWPFVGAAGNTMRSFPTNPAEMLASGNVLSIVWTTGGASAGGTDADGLVVEYLEIDAL